MKIKNYTKINLRDFRHNLTKLKDSIEAGEIFQVVEKGNPLAYFVSAKYEIQIEKSERGLTQEDFKEALKSPTGDLKFLQDKSYEKEYRKLLEKKYLKK